MALFRSFLQDDIKALLCYGKHCPLCLHHATQSAQPLSSSCTVFSFFLYRFFETFIFISQHLQSMMITSSQGVGTHTTDLNSLFIRFPCLVFLLPPSLVHSRKIHPLVSYDLSFICSLIYLFFGLLM